MKPRQRRNVMLSLTALLLALGAGGWYAYEHSLTARHSVQNIPSHSTPPTSTNTTPSPPASTEPATPTKPTPAPAVMPTDIRGVIEGFYGEPWTTEQRISMLEFMGQHHYNTYVYAPKDDPYQRKQWSQPYPQTQLRDMQTLSETATRNNLHFVYSLSPGLPAPLSGETSTQEDINRSMTFSASTDRDALAAKIDQLRGIGVHEFLLSFDDVQEKLKPADQNVYGTNLSAAHVAVANELYQRERQLDPEFELWFAPTSYYGVRDNPYWQTIRTQLDPAIPVIWTGNWVLNQTITSAEADDVTKLLGRKPLLWDNYPVNDYTYVVKKAPQLLLGPLEGRASDLPAHLAGYIANPMVQPESSKVALATIGDYLENPATYQAGTSWKNALRSLDGIGDPGAWQLFSSYAQESTLREVSNPDFAQMAREYWSASTPQTRATAAARLRQEFTNLSLLPSKLHSSLHNPQLLSEIDPWLQKLGHEANAGLAALDYLAAPAGDPQKSALRQTLQARLQTAQSTNLKIGADILTFAQTAAAR